ncbi:MAG: type II/IV secretion system protein [bacterium]|nr:type II/IV secretion system protein [bacterium]
MNFIDIKSKEVLDKLTSFMIELYDHYTPDLNTEGRRELDWDLCSKGILPELDLLNTYHKISNFKIREEEELNQINGFSSLSLDYLENQCCIPFSWTEDEIEIVLSDPYSIDMIYYLFDKLFDLKVTFTLGRRSVIERLIQEVYNRDDIDEDGDDAFSGNADSEEALRTMASEAKIVRLVNEMFSRAVEMEASDIHVEPEENKYVIRFRIDGILKEFMSASLNQYPAVASRIKLVGGLNIAESRLPQDGRTSIQLGKSDIDIRINTIPTLNGESIVLRLLRKDAMEFKLKGMGMNDTMLKIFDKIIAMPHGIILVVGPTGSGKSTTLYSIMSQLNTPGKKIITIEDPVEYKIPRLSQMQVNPKIGLDFAGALRNIVRQDPDIILVGEIRDRETADISINAALTGHLVLSTLHTNDAPGAVSRLLDMGVENFLISSSLIAVLSQRLVRRICTKCNGKGVNSRNTKCKKCGGSGFKGRTGIFELMPINDDIRKAILKNADSSSIKEIAIKSGMLPLVKDGLDKVNQGITTRAEVVRASSDE